MIIIAVIACGWSDHTGVCADSRIDHHHRHPHRPLHDHIIQNRHQHDCSPTVWLVQLSRSLLRHMGASSQRLVRTNQPSGDHDDDHDDDDGEEAGDVGDDDEERGDNDEEVDDWLTAVRLNLPIHAKQNQPEI